MKLGWLAPLYCPRDLFLISALCWIRLNLRNYEMKIHTSVYCGLWAFSFWTVSITMLFFAIIPIYSIFHLHFWISLALALWDIGCPSLLKSQILSSLSQFGSKKALPYFSSQGILVIHYSHGFQYASNKGPSIFRHPCLICKVDLWIGSWIFVCLVYAAFALWAFGTRWFLKRCWGPCFDIVGRIIVCSCNLS